MTMLELLVTALGLLFAFLMLVRVCNWIADCCVAVMKWRQRRRVQ